MELRFTLRGLDGHVRVSYAANDRPEDVGAAASAVGFPHCHASVDYPARGYDAVLGWVQLVRSDDNVSHGREFEIDPLDFLGDVPHPFCWIGLNPQLFDSPWREPRQDMHWIAHSFLCVPDGGAGRYEVHALTGFSWGFHVRDEQIELVPPTPLTASDWEQHIPPLTARYPSWRFTTGLRSD